MCYITQFLVYFGRTILTFLQKQDYIVLSRGLEMAFRGKQGSQGISQTDTIFMLSTLCISMVYFVMLQPVTFIFWNMTMCIKLYSNIIFGQCNYTQYILVDKLMVISFRYHIDFVCVPYAKFSVENKPVCKNLIGHFISCMISKYKFISRRNTQK